MRGGLRVSCLLIGAGARERYTSLFVGGVRGVEGTGAKPRKGIPVVHPVSGQGLSKHMAKATRLGVQIGVIHPVRVKAMRLTAHHLNPAGGKA